MVVCAARDQGVAAYLRNGAKPDFRGQLRVARKAAFLFSAATQGGRGGHLHALCEGLGVLEDLQLVFLELWRGSLLQGTGQPRNGVVVRTTLQTPRSGCLCSPLKIRAQPFNMAERHLQTRENGEVDFVLQVVHDWGALLVCTLLALAVENHRTAGPCAALPLDTAWLRQTDAMEAHPTAKRLVCRCGDNICIVEGRRNDTSCHKA